MKYKNECQICGKIFITKNKTKKYCCSDCKKIAARIRKDECDQPCWICRNATGNCLWSSESKPIKNWNAEPVYKKERDGYIRRTYKIISCPEFIHD